MYLENTDLIALVIVLGTSLTTLLMSFNYARQLTRQNYELREALRIKS
jgi:Flp pilus assembly protein TadB